MMSKFPLALGLILLFGACSSPESATAEPVQSAPEANEAANDAFSTLVDEGPSIELLSVDAAVHLDTIEVRVTGAEPFSDGVLVQCASDPSLGVDLPSRCDMQHSVQVQTDEFGDAEAAISVRAYIGVGTRLELACPEQECTIGFGTLESFTLATDTELPWETDETDRILPPAISVELRSVDLDANSSQALVQGVGFAPNSQVRLSQCPLASNGLRGVDAEDCLYDFGAPPVTANSEGIFTVEMTLFPIFQRSNGELIECFSDSGAICVVADPFPLDGLNRLSFSSGSEFE